MPESPLVQKETVALTDLEALIAARAKGESETELGFRKRIEREEAEYRAAAKQLAAKYQVDDEHWRREYSRAREQVVADVSARHAGDQGRVRPDQEADRRPVEEGSAPGQEKEGRNRLAGPGVLRGLARRGRQVAARDRSQVERGDPGSPYQAGGRRIRPQALRQARESARTRRGGRRHRCCADAEAAAPTASRAGARDRGARRRPSAAPAADDPARRSGGRRDAADDPPSKNSPRLPAEAPVDEDRWSRFRLKRPHRRRI